MFNRKLIPLFAVLTAIVSCSQDTALNPEHILWYTSPAELWEETLPLGNGRLGMMPDGGVVSEKIVLNEISMWSGSEADYANPDAAESLSEIRALLLEGKNAEAQEVMYERFVPDKPSDGGTYGGYQTLGDLRIDYSGIPGLDSNNVVRSAYCRWLDLREATAYTEFEVDGTDHYRKYYVSRESDVMVVEIGSEAKGSVGFDVRLGRKQNCQAEKVGDNMLKISGTLDSGTDKPGVRYAAYAKVIAIGSKAEVSAAEDPCVRVKDADKAWIVISVATSFFAAALTFFRNPYYAFGYLLNDVVLIVLWGLACANDISNIVMVACFVMFFANDLYGFYNWMRMQKRQKNERSEEMAK
jgi:alpha-L-fucosidase 2